jgi:hypothetical protein
LIGRRTWPHSVKFFTRCQLTPADDIRAAAYLGSRFEAWVRPTALSGWNTIVMKGWGTNAMAYALYANDSVPRPAGYVSIASVDRSAIGTSGLPLNTWTHLAFTYGGGMLRLYVNGVQVGTRAITGNVRMSAETLTIGGNSVWGEWFNGTIDEVRLYNRELTAAEIQAGMAQTVGGS